MPLVLASARLYGIVDLGYVDPDRIESVTRELLDGGVDLLQLRAKDHAAGDILGFGRRIRPLCRAAGIPFIVNDHPQLAVELDADGLHLGQDDGTLASARGQVGPSMILGRSTHSPAQARAARDEGFDYIGFGPLFPTPTKLGRPGIGLGDIATVEREVGPSLPVFCIGGIRRANLAQVLAAGARRVVIVSDLLKAAQPELAVREAKAAIADCRLRIAD